MDLQSIILLLFIIGFIVLSLRWPSAALIVVLFSMQFGQFIKPEISGRHVLIALSDVGTLLLLPCVILPYVLTEGIESTRSSVWRGWVVYLFAVMLSLLGAQDLLRWGAGFRIIVQDLIIFVAAIVAIKSARQARNVVVAILLWGCLSVGVLVFNVFLGSATYVSVLATKTTDVSFARSNYLASILLLLVPLCVGLNSGASRRWSHAFLLAVLLVLGAGIVLTKSRAGMVVLGLYCSLSLFKTARQFRRQMLFAACAAAGVYAAATLAPDVTERTLGVMPGVVEFTDDTQFIARKALWEDNFNSFIESPVIGKGLLNTLVQRDTFDTEHLFLEPHNHLIQVLAETGLTGLVGFAFLWIVMIKELWNGVHRFPKHDWRGGVVKGALGAIATAFAHGLVENNILTKEFGLVLWMVLGLAIAVIRLRERELAQAKQRRWLCSGIGPASGPKMLTSPYSGYTSGYARLE